jgi:transposase
MMTAVGDNRPDALTEAIFQASVWFVELESNFANFADRVLTPERPRGINKGMRNTRDLTDEQWKIFDPLIPKPRRRGDGRGRPWKSRRSVLNGVLWVLRTGAPWADLPDRYPSFQTCHRRFQQWVRSGMMKKIMTALARELSAQGAIDVSEAIYRRKFRARDPRYRPTDFHRDRSHDRQRSCLPKRSRVRGLVPRQHSTGGKARLLGISKRGNPYLPSC